MAKHFYSFCYNFIYKCIPGLFLKPESQNEDVTLNIEPEKSDSVIKVLKEFLHIRVLDVSFRFFVCGFQITLVATHVPRYVQDRGLDDWTGFAILSLIGLFNIIGVLIMGYLSDKYSKKMLIGWTIFFRAISNDIFIFLPPSNISAITFE